MHPENQNQETKIKYVERRKSMQANNEMNTTTTTTTTTTYFMSSFNNIDINDEILSVAAQELSINNIFFGIFQEVLRCQRYFENKR